MNLLLFPGGSKKNKTWIAEVADALSPLFEETHARDYKNWDEDSKEVDLALEIDRTIETINGFDPYCVFAKSAGTMVTSKATAEGMLYPKACLFAGLPLAMIINQSLPADEWLRATEFPIIILQNEHDPLGSFQEVSAYVQGLGRTNISVHKLPGDTHDYLDMDTLRQYMEQLI